VFVTFGFRNKPSVCVATAAVKPGQSRAEHLAQMRSRQKWFRCVTTCYSHSSGRRSTRAGEPKNPITNLALSILLDDLSWWGEALKSARTLGVLPPAMFRQMAAQTAEAIAEDV